MAKAKVQKTANPTTPIPAMVAGDNFEAGCNAGLVVDVGAGKFVGLLVILESVIRIPVEDDMEPVGEGNGEVRLIVAAAIVENPFEYIYVNEYAAHPAFPALSMSTSCVAGQF
jgi:hypothetical protein